MANRDFNHGHALDAGQLPAEGPYRPVPGAGSMAVSPILLQLPIALEKALTGWMRIVFFAAILFSHCFEIPYEFVDGRGWVSAALLVRDFGVVGFFMVAGQSLQLKRMERGGVVLPGNLMKLTIAAAALAAFEWGMAHLKGSETAAPQDLFYAALYDSNLWFFVAYTFAGPLLLALDRRGVWTTAACCLLFVAVPAQMPMESRLILQSISFAFVCMALGASLYGRRVHAGISLAVAGAVLVLRLSFDDAGRSSLDGLDVVLRLVYGAAMFMVLKAVAERITARRRAPGWTSTLFVPYLAQLPMVNLAKVGAAALFVGAFPPRTAPIFDSPGSELLFMGIVFAAVLSASFALAAFLRRHDVRL